MPSSLSLPCARCGRPVSVTPPLAAPPRCDRCLPGPSEWIVHRGANSERMDRATLLSRLKAGVVAPTDFVGDGKGASQPIAAHPAFRSAFLPGHADHLGPLAEPAKAEGLLGKLFGRTATPAAPPPAPMKAAAPAPAKAASAPAKGAAPAPKGAVAKPPPGKAPAPRRSSGPLLAVLALVAVGGGVYAWSEGLIPGLDSGAPVARPAPAARPADTPDAPKAEAPPAPAASPDEETLDQLVARVGVVEEARAELLARAWNARYRGSEQATAEALALAERAVARLPRDVETLGLFAELASETGRYPRARVEAMERARTTAPTHPASMRAVAAVAWADDEAEEAAAVARRCVEANPTELGCQWWAARTLPAESPLAGRLDALDQLARAWPANRAVPRAAALLAAAEGAPDAERRVEKARGLARDDQGLATALARLKLARGDIAGAEKLVESLGAAAPADVRVALAEGALRAGQPGRAVALLAAVEADAVGDAELARRVRVVRAQGLYLQARTAGDVAAAKAALATPPAPGTSADPALAQARVLTGVLAGDLAAATRAWDLADLDRAKGRELARLWLARAALDLANGLPRDATTSVERAHKADFRVPEVHLWAARVALAGQDAPAAMNALRRAVREVDGTDARRDPQGDLLPLPADVDALLRELDAQVGSEATLESRRALSVAVVAWLSGDLATARARLEPLARASDAPADVSALDARLRLAAGDAAGALAAVDRATTTDPREPAWHLLRAQTLVALGRPTDAALELATVKSAGALGSLAWSVEAQALEALGDRTRATEAARAATEADPADRDAARLYGRLSTP